jgi:hypothetical protein
MQRVLHPNRSIIHICKFGLTLYSHPLKVPPIYICSTVHRMLHSLLEQA